MSKCSPQICENCRHWCLATMNHHSTCVKGRAQRYIWPEKMGDAHGYAPARAGCFEKRPKGAPMFAARPRDRWNKPPGMAAARKLKEAA